MSAFPARTDSCTFEDFVALLDDGVKADLIEGVIYMASPDNTDANRLNLWLACVLTLFVETRKLGKIYISRVAYRIGLRNGPEPDIGYVPKELESTRRRGYIDGPPMLAIEIVSPDSVDRDYILKRAMYEQAGVREYWILDPDDGRVTFLRLVKDRFVEIAPATHIYRSEVLPGFSIGVRWLLAGPRPLPNVVVENLIGKRKKQGTRKRKKP